MIYCLVVVSFVSELGHEHTSFFFDGLPSKTIINVLFWSEIHCGFIDCFSSIR